MNLPWSLSTSRSRLTPHISPLRQRAAGEQPVHLDARASAERRARRIAHGERRCWDPRRQIASNSNSRRALRAFPLPRASADRPTPTSRPEGPMHLAIERETSPAQHGKPRDVSSLRLCLTAADTCRRKSLPPGLISSFAPASIKLSEQNSPLAACSIDLELPICNSRLWDGSRC